MTAQTGDWGHGVKVYVLETGCYEERSVDDVYATPEAAMAAWNPPAGKVRGHEYGKWAGVPWEYTWQEVNAGRKREEWEKRRWVFAADWHDAAEITEYEVVGGRE